VTKIDKPVFANVSEHFARVVVVVVVVVVGGG
jgi:hypothetical protein